MRCVGVFRLWVHVICYHSWFYSRMGSLFQEEIRACATIHMHYVMDACDHVRFIILLPPMIGTSFVLVTLTGLIVSEPKHWVTWSHRAVLNFLFLRGKRIQYLVFLLSHIIFNSFLLVVESSSEKLEIFLCF